MGCTRSLSTHPVEVKQRKVGVVMLTRAEGGGTHQEVQLFILPLVIGDAGDGSVSL